MKKTALIVLLIISFLNYSNAQEPFEKVTKQYSFETGYHYIFNTNFDSVSAGGYTFLFDYAWKLSGFNKKANAYISVPLGYTYHPESSTGNPASILYYGWTVRHELTKDKKITPYFGYALLLNQFRYFDADGSIFGHQTRFDFGVNYSLKERLILYAKLEYSYSRFPSLGNATSNKMHTGGIKLGLRF